MNSTTGSSNGGTRSKPSPDHTQGEEASVIRELWAAHEDVIRAAGRDAVAETVAGAVVVGMLAMTIVIAAGGGFADLPAPVWWVAVGALGATTLDAICDVAHAWLHRRRIRRCVTCRAIEIEVDALVERWADLHVGRDGGVR